MLGCVPFRDGARQANDDLLAAAFCIASEVPHGLLTFTTIGRAELLRPNASRGGLHFVISDFDAIERDAQMNACDRVASFMHGDDQIAIIGIGFDRGAPYRRVVAMGEGYLNRTR